MVASLVTLFLAADPISACPPTALRPGLHDLQLTVANTARTYHLSIPKGPMPKGGYPLVLSFHAAASTAAGHAVTTKLRDKAEVAGFVLVEPEGYSGNYSKRTWNAGTCCGAAAAAKIDDVAFARAIVQQVKSDHACIDEHRVFAVGHGNGGMLAHRIGCEAADVFAAVASVSGAIADKDPRAFECNPSRPMSVLAIHGTADKCHPLLGGKGQGLDTTTKRSVKETLDEWRQRAQCSAKMRLIRKTGPVACRTYDKCTGGADVQLCEVQGQGHGWPGSEKYEMQALCGGEQVKDANANDLLWAFFAAHSLSK